jgi:hypothetical protein
MGVPIGWMLNGDTPSTPDRTGIIADLARDFGSLTE